jgi:anti-sigma factor RsiW
MVLYCREFVSFLDDYFGGKLPLDRRAEFEAHIAVCPPCVNYMKSYQETVRLGKAACADLDAPVPPTIPEELVQAILAARAGKQKT